MLRFDSAGVSSAAGHVRDQAAALIDLGRSCAAMGADVGDAVVASGLDAVCGVCADVFAVVALDLGLLEELMVAGAVLYTDVERRAIQAGGR
ncbi:MAG: hypothetical protein ACRDV1_08995 [Actinomycetes bacterium]